MTHVRVVRKTSKGIDRGIFGITSAKRSEIHGLVELLESRNPTPDPTDRLHDKVRDQNILQLSSNNSAKLPLTRSP